MKRKDQGLPKPRELKNEGSRLGEGRGEGAEGDERRGTECGYLSPAFPGGSLRG